MRASDSKPKRNIDRDKLRAYLLLVHRPGEVINIGSWYSEMRELGLQHSDRQRLSELRKEGLLMNYDRKLEGYRYNGFLPSGQLSLLEHAA